MERIKLIWEFRGPGAEKTAEHHVIHLNEFAEREKLVFKEVKVEKLSDMFAIATIIVEKDVLEIVKTALKPHKGQMIKD